MNVPVESPQRRCGRKRRNGSGFVDSSDGPHLQSLVQSKVRDAAKVDHLEVEDLSEDVGTSLCFPRTCRCLSPTPPIPERGVARGSVRDQTARRRLAFETPTRSRAFGIFGEEKLRSLASTIEFVSLGCCLSVGEALQTLRLQSLGYPFDWTRSPVTGVINCLENDFWGFMSYDRVFNHEAKNSLVYSCSSTWGGSFWVHDIDSPKTQDDFAKRIERFYGHLDVSASKPRVFVRALNSTEELHATFDLHDALRWALPKSSSVKLLILIDMQSTSGMMRVEGERCRDVLFCRVTGHTNDPVESVQRQIHVYSKSIAAAVQAWECLDEVQQFSDVSMLAASVDPFHGGDPARDPFCPVSGLCGEEALWSRRTQTTPIAQTSLASPAVSLTTPLPEETCNIIYVPSVGRKAVAESSPTSTVSTSEGSPASVTTTAGVDGTEADMCECARSQQQGSPKPERQASSQCCGWSVSTEVHVQVKSDSWHPGCRRTSPLEGRLSPCSSVHRFHRSSSAVRASNPGSPHNPRVQSWTFQTPHILMPSSETVRTGAASSRPGSVEVSTSRCGQQCGSSNDSLQQIAVPTVAQTAVPPTQTAAPVRFLVPSRHMSSVGSVAFPSSVSGQDKGPRVHMATQQGQFISPVRNQSFQR